MTKANEPMTVERVAAGLTQALRRIDALEHALDLFCTNEQLDGQRGDPKVRFDPKGWRGDKCKGKKASECPPDFLDAYASTIQWFADNPKPIDENLGHAAREEAIKDRDKGVKFDKLDAKRCRSWARRKRLDGWKPPPPPPEPAGLGDLPALGGSLGGDDPFGAPSLGEVPLGLEGGVYGDTGGLSGTTFLSSDQVAAEADIRAGGNGLPTPPADDSDLAGPWDAVAPAPAAKAETLPAPPEDDDLAGLPE